MSYTTILAALKTLLDAVTGIGKTYDHFKWATDITTQKTLFTTAGGIFHTWFLTRSSCPVEPYTNKQENRKQVFDLWGYYAVDVSAESEKTFQALCDTILDKFNDIDNKGISATVRAIDSMQILEVTYVEWCNVLCHRAQMQITIEEEIDVT